MRWEGSLCVKRDRNLVGWERRVKIDQWDLQQLLAVTDTQETMDEQESAPLFSPEKQAITLPRNPLLSKHPSTSPQSAQIPALAARCQSTRPSAGDSEELCEGGRIKVEVYCRSWQLECSGQEEIRQMQADIQELQTSSLTKLCLQLILFRKLSQQNLKYHPHFRSALHQYETFKTNQGLPPILRPT